MMRQPSMHLMDHDMLDYSLHQQKFLNSIRDDFFSDIGDGHKKPNSRNNPISSRYKSKQYQSKDKRFYKEELDQ